MKRLNEQGSVLQIVLITFMIMTFVLTSFLFIIQMKVNHYYDIDRLMKQKNLEVLLTKYYLDQMQNDILISDSFTEDQYDISYTVDDLGNQYEIITSIESNIMNYQFLINVSTDTFEITKFEYLEE